MLGLDRQHETISQNVDPLNPMIIFFVMPSSYISGNRYGRHGHSIYLRLFLLLFHYPLHHIASPSSLGHNYERCFLAAKRSVKANMKGLVRRPHGGTAEVEEIDTPVQGPTEILVRVDVGEALKKQCHRRRKDETRDPGLGVFSGGEVRKIFPLSYYSSCP